MPVQKKSLTKATSASAPKPTTKSLKTAAPNSGKVVASRVVAARSLSAMKIVS